MKTHSPSSPVATTFLFGILFGATGLYLLGTKAGRKLVYRLLEAAEHFDTISEDLMKDLEKKMENGDMIDSLEVFKQEFMKKKEHTGSLYSVMERIKSVMPVKDTKEAKKS